MTSIIDSVYPTIIYYNDDHSVTPVCTDKIEQTLKIKYTTPSTWHELVEELEVESGTKFLTFHADMINRSIHSTAIEFIDAITTISKFIPSSKDLKITVIIKPTTTLSVIRDLQKSKIQGILLDLNFYSIEEVAVSTNAHINGIPYWPKHIIDSLPGNSKNTAKRGLISLTPRQNQVFKFITERGASNKVIAKALGISESTVKLHVTEIFKKYGVKNRTQLAVFSNS